MAAYGGATLTAGAQRTVHLPASVPSTATAVVINLTGTGATGSTYLTVYPNAYPGTSNLNLSRTDSSAAVSATVALSAAHTFNVRNAGSRTHVIIDVLGYYAPTGNGFGSLDPYFRVLDTRTALGGHHRPVGNREAVTVSLASYAQVPADATAVAALNVTASGERSSGYVATGATSFGRSSTLNYLANTTRANLAVVGLSNRSFKVGNFGLGADLVVDVVGYYSPSATGLFHPLPSPVRIGGTQQEPGDGLARSATAANWRCSRPVWARCRSRHRNRR